MNLGALWERQPMTCDRETHEKIAAAVRTALESIGFDVIRRSEFFGLNERAIAVQKAA